MRINPPKEAYDIVLFDGSVDEYRIKATAEQVDLVQALHAVIEAAGDRPGLQPYYRVIVQGCFPHWSSHSLSVFIADALRYRRGQCSESP